MAIFLALQKLTHMYDAFIHDACFSYACIHDVMHVSMILDPETCMYDAYIHPDTHDYDAQCCIYP